MIDSGARLMHLPEIEEGCEMSGTATAEVSYGAKAMHGSAFATMGRMLDRIIRQWPEHPDKGYARLAHAGLKMALLEAEDEAKANPDAMGPQQDDLLLPPRGSTYIRTTHDDGSVEYLKNRKLAWQEARLVDKPDTIATYCRILGIDVDLFRSTSASILDQVADRARADGPATSADVICIEEARQRRKVAAAVRLEFVPVLSRRRMVGEQLAWII